MAFATRCSVSELSRACSSMAQNAELLARDNGFESVVQVVHGRVEEVVLPEKVEHTARCHCTRTPECCAHILSCPTRPLKCCQVDIIVSEWMGSEPQAAPHALLCRASAFQQRR